ncbi:MAG: HEAT repeat domain-containing protein [Chloroflexi bacterium]|nr:HEAT repeat domain-containing protein [Chloroflexota bacterium]
MPPFSQTGDEDMAERGNGDVPGDAPDDAEASDADGDEQRRLPPPETVLEAVADETFGLPFADLPALSGADDRTVGLAMALLPRLQPQRRRDLLAAMQQLSEDDVTLDFDRIHLAALLDQDVATRILAMHGLREHDRLEYAELLTGIVGDDPASAVRAEAATSLGNFVVGIEFGMVPTELAERIAEALRERVEDVTEDDEVRGTALEAAGASSEEWVAELIAEQYETGNTRMRVASVVAMGCHGSDDWLPILIQSFEDEDDDVRAAAATSAGQLLLEAAIQPLTLLLDEEQEPDVQVAAIRAMGEIAGEEAEAILVRLLESDEPHIAEAADLAIEELQMMSVDFQAEALQ